MGDTMPLNNKIQDIDSALEAANYFDRIRPKIGDMAATVRSAISQLKAQEFTYEAVMNTLHYNGDRGLPPYVHFCTNAAFREFSNNDFPTFAKNYLWFTPEDVQSLIEALVEIARRDDPTLYTAPNHFLSDHYVIGESIELKLKSGVTLEVGLVLNIELSPSGKQFMEAIFLSPVDFEAPQEG